MADATRAAIDRAMLPGFDWPDAMQALTAHPWPITAANACYTSLGWQPGVLLLAYVGSGREGRCWTFLAAWIVALLIVAAVFAVLPGLGAYAHYGIAAAVLLGWGFWPVRPLRLPMASLNAGMLAAAVPAGGHYLIDIPAGIVVAMLAILAARRWVESVAEHPREDRVDVLEVIVEVEARGDFLR